MKTEKKLFRIGEDIKVSGLKHSIKIKSSGRFTAVGIGNRGAKHLITENEKSGRLWTNDGREVFRKKR